MDSPELLLTFTLSGRPWALPLSAVERVVRVVEVTPVPQTPALVRGVINLQGRIIPVLDLRAASAAPLRDLDLSDLLIIARSPTRTVALVAEDVGGILEAGQEDVAEGDALVTGLGQVGGVVKHDGEPVLITSLDRLLSPEIESTLREALEGEGLRNDPADFARPAGKTE